MDIQAKKMALVKMLLETDNPKIIESIKKIFKKERSSDFWNELSLEQRMEIELASEEIANGEVIDYELFIRNHR
ncbi:hypothetical protein NBRC110019_26370 [Neptunitalea chrysea]|uniref:Uncharacterized protein n=1 Tax=Neptunitalea chrysea TaxID=1647581 RepID=A0A9W6B685_9FLAO|nr:hypothetical protein [Neptunitalea chrysea]GLB53596.1 hypothetical protein NBRC110019_26370 [Neptunitalea chrysea]